MPEAGVQLLLQRPRYRVVRVLDADFPAFYRVIWQAHVAEFSDLEAADRTACMDAVIAVERALREQLQPRKVNLATLGNVVPHLHWHVIARFDWDSHFPAPIWAAAQRPADGAQLAALAQALPALDEAVLAALRALPD
ncbi:HIT family protein [Paucibacter sp. DJ2R-2]|nr:HIT family protein [Paucibacter sp. DJ2R-2]MCV2421674.1 HIT family protein [Paucibacter sp. DJ4R-1]MCV2438379.1 HIT family protein [Paucibacter sp. DJ2R-2]